MTGTAYRVSSTTDRIGNVFLWDMFNPWAGWMELNSTHPLTGKRIRALSNYAEQLDLKLEFDMAAVLRKGSQLSKQRLYRGFVLDLLLYMAEAIGLVGGIVLAMLWSAGPARTEHLLAFPLVGLGLGILIKAWVMYPSFANAQAMTILDLMGDAYASPLRGIPVELHGTLIGRGEAGYVFGSDLQLQDSTGLLFTRYSSRFGPLGNFLFGLQRVKALIGSSGTMVGWFRRGVASSLDLMRLQSDAGGIINSYPRFWSFLSGGLLLILGLYLSGAGKAISG